MRSDESREPMFSVGVVTRFYVPLLLQGFSQSLAYPARFFDIMCA